MCGLLPTLTVQEHHYSMTLVDDHIQKYWVSVFHTKDEALNKLKTKVVANLKL
jgi:hypothetical protein